MADAFAVDPEALANATERMDEFVKHTESVVAEIDSLITQLHLTWSGRAAVAHAEAHSRWTHGEAIMREALRRLQTVGSTAHHNYTQVAATNSAMWS